MSDEARAGRRVRRGTARLAAAVLATAGLLAAGHAADAGSASGRVDVPDRAGRAVAGRTVSPSPAGAGRLAAVEEGVQGGGALAARPSPVAAGTPRTAHARDAAAGAPAPVAAATATQARTSPTVAPPSVPPATVAPPRTTTPTATAPATPTARPTTPPTTAPTAPPTIAPTVTATPGASPRSLTDAITDAIRDAWGTPTPAATPVPTGPDCRRVKCVALTFDDGPGPYTATLLRHLAARKARATFFVVGQNVVAHPDLVRRAAAAGHEIGGHSWSHRDLTTLRAASIRADLARTAKAVKAATGVAPTIMRPPYGAQNAYVRKHAKQPMIMWSVDTLDWRYRSSARVARVAVKNARPGGIILFHDIHPTTVKAIPRVLKKLSARGYHFVTVSELLGTAPGKLVYRGPRP
ncbi:polysaccharide deacetylase family protein [Nonomuraea indica]|uniref:Polysaccharide deacetylase family protein n=1 Tax=Nonomuraea indica TaxID=1581193 RepID=A0ABW7ZXS3_9ACTN